RSCWYVFRDRLAPHLEDLNRPVLAIALEQGLTPARRGALDGTLVAADASRRRLLDEAKLRERCAGLDQAAGAGGAAAARPRWMAPTPEGRRRQRQRLRRAQERMGELQGRNADKRASKRVARGRVWSARPTRRRPWGGTRRGCTGPCTTCRWWTTWTRP